MQPDEAAVHVTCAVEQMDNSSGWRHMMAARGAYLYERMGHGELFGSRQYYDCKAKVQRVDRQTWGYGKSIIDTLVAKVVGLDNVKTQMVTTDALWEDRKDAIWADRFIEGNAHMAQGNYSNVWDLGRAAVTLAAAGTGIAGIRTEPDLVFKRVSHELRSTLSTFIDPMDVHHGRPMAFFDVTWESPEILAEDPRWSEHKDHIAQSAVGPPDWMLSGDELNLGTKLVKVITAWRLPFGSFKGREARFVNGKAIQWDDYPHDRPRIAFFRASRPLGGGFWGASLIDAIGGPLGTADRIMSRTEEALDELSHATFAVDTASTSDQSLVNARNVKFLKYDSLKGAAPQALNMPVVDQSRQNLFERSVQGAHELLGVDQMHTGGKRPEGMTSGRGVRMVASLFAERHSLFQREWRNFIAVEVARNNIAAAVEIGEVEPGWQVTWPGQDFDLTVGVDRIKRIQDKSYTMRPYAVSEQKNEPGDRGEMANEMLANQQITPEAHAIITSTTFDPHSELKGTSGQRRFFAMLIDKAMHADREDLEDPDFWLEDYKSPPEWTIVPDALAQMYAAYWQALVSDVSQFRREILKRTLRELDAMLQQQKQAEAAASNLSVSVDAPSVAAAMGGAPPEGAINEGPTGATAQELAGVDIGAGAIDPTGALIQ